MADFGKLNFSVSFNPTSAFPLDARYYFDRKDAADEAASAAVEVGSSDGTYFIGQTIAVNESEVVTLYTIQPNKTLKEVGSVTLGDDKSITIVDGKLSIKGFGEATEGQQLRIKDGNLEWFTPDTSTVEGLSSTVGALQSDVTNLKPRVKANEDAIVKLNGDGTEGSVKKTAKDTALEVITQWAENETKNEKVDTFKELVNWVDTHGTEVESLTTQITQNQQAIETLNGSGAGSVSQTVKDAIEAAIGSEDEPKYALKTTVDELQSTVGEHTSSIQTLTTQIGQKADDSVVQPLVTKLAGIAEGANVNVIDSVDDTNFSILPEGKKLQLTSVGMDKVTGLAAALEEKLDSADLGDINTKLDGIEDNAQVNVIEVIKAGDQVLSVEAEKTVTIPAATAAQLGLVKVDDKTIQAEDGVISVKAVNVQLLEQTEGEELILNAGTSK